MHDGFFIFNIFRFCTSTSGFHENKNQSTYFTIGESMEIRFSSKPSVFDFGYCSEVSMAERKKVLFSGAAEVQAFLAQHGGKVNERNEQGSRAQPCC